MEYSLSPVEVVANLSQLADKLKQCCAGEVKIPNTTKVTDPKSPSTIPYNGKISLKDFKDERISQPTTVAWLSLVSDDGCDISYTTGNGEKTDWLKEYGKGHDISKGRRDCPHVLKAGSYNFQIKYSQTYYNPKPGTSDLDGISLVVAPIVVDICIGEKSIPYSKSHLFLEKKQNSGSLSTKFTWQKGLPKTPKTYPSHGKLKLTPNARNDLMELFWRATIRSNQTTAPGNPSAKAHASPILQRKQN